MFLLTDIHTHDSVPLNVYSLTISTLNILVNITNCCFIGWYWMTWVASLVLKFLVSKLYCSYELEFFVFTCIK